MVQINYNLYRYFFAVMEHGTISQAAKELGCSQPTVTYSLQTLAKDLGTALFVVGRHGVEPTPNAIALHQALKPYYVGFTQVVTNFTRSV